MKVIKLTRLQVLVLVALFLLFIAMHGWFVGALLGTMACCLLVLLETWSR